MLEAQEIKETGNKKVSTAAAKQSRNSSQPKLTGRHKAITHKPLRADYASARFRLLIASSISCVFLKPIVAQSTPAFWKANLIAFTRSS